MTVEEIIRELPKGLVKWHTFQPAQRALYITCGTLIDDALADALKESGVSVDCVETGQLEEICNNQYDYVVVTSAIEHTDNIKGAVNLLKHLRRAVKDQGKLFLGMDNRLGIRYFCGDRDKYTNRNFDGVENYIRSKLYSFEQMKGRCYAKAEIKEMLEASGFSSYRFFSVFPVLERPQILLADDYLPNEQLEIRIFPQYNYAGTVFLEEEILYDTLIKNDLFHTMANAFWIECSLDGILPDAGQVTMSMDRGRENAMFTIVHKSGYVEKRPVYEEGRYKLDSLQDSVCYLREHNINMIATEIKNNACIMPYITAQSAVDYLRKQLIAGREIFLHEMDRIWNIILNSSEHVPFEDIDWERYMPGWENRVEGDPLKEKWKKIAYGTQDEQDSIGVILKRGYIDLVPLNAFYDGKDYIYYDQELYIENLPAKVIMLRTIDIVYLKNEYLEDLLSAEDLKKRYGLLQCQDLFCAFTRKFLRDLRNDRILKDYHKMVRKNVNTIHSNRQKINYSTEEYDRLFRNIFKGTDNRKLYLFGTGQFAQSFLSQYGDECSITGFIDNDPDKWGKDLEGICIYPPDILNTLETATFKVIICIRNYRTVMEQLVEMGITDFSVYDCNLLYERPKKIIADFESDNKKEKKYNIGYIAGVFDLYHIGHLNLFKRAKEQCNYLIVGVVTDEGVVQKKHTMPYIPFEERIELVRSCRYVDEAVEIPLELYDTDEAYRRYQFDVQFSGSDYVDSPAWIAKREYLRKRGADLVFFPYTQSTSSTKIKGLIDNELMQGEIR